MPPQVQITMCGTNCKPDATSTSPRHACPLRIAPTYQHWPDRYAARDVRDEKEKIEDDTPQKSPAARTTTKSSRLPSVATIWSVPNTLPPQTRKGQLTKSPTAPSHQYYTANSPPAPPWPTNHMATSPNAPAPSTATPPRQRG